VRRLLLGLIRGYQVVLSPVFGSSCRYYPSCSQYTYEAVEKYGPVRGIWMGVKRISRCHPFTRGGYDPVP
jgi:putative membrane protein insertion efficiency factor